MFNHADQEMFQLLSEMVLRENIELHTEEYRSQRLDPIPLR